MTLKEDKLDSLERNFAEKHETIKRHVETFIDLEHRNEKIVKEAKHKTNLTKMEAEKQVELMDRASK